MSEKTENGNGNKVYSCFVSKNVNYADLNGLDTGEYDLEVFYNPASVKNLMF